MIDFGLDFKRFVYENIRYKSRPEYLLDGSRSETEFECVYWKFETFLTGYWIPCEYPLKNINYFEKKCYSCQLVNISEYDDIQECMFCKKTLDYLEDIND